MREKYLISTILKRLMAQKDIRTMDLAREIHVPQSTLHRIVTGESTKPHQTTLKSIANYFDISIEQLKGRFPIPWLNISGLFKLNAPQISEVPLINWHQTADLIKTNYNFNILEYEKTVLTDVQISEKTYALVMNDSSMEPLFSIGTTLIIDPALAVQNRRYIIVKLHSSQETTFRQLIIDGSNYYLKPLCPNQVNFNWHILEEEDQYCGTLVQAIRDF